MKIIVGTVIAGNSGVVARKWLAMQLFMLRATVDFEHVAVMYPQNKYKIYRANVKYYSKHTTMLDDREDGPLHSAGLSTLNRYFLSRIDEFDGFLFLDSDAFPIRSGWLEDLTNSIRNRYDIAINYRPECGETRLHASTIYATSCGIQKLKFVAERRMARGNDHVELDTYVDPYTNDWVRALRLIRTNKINVHPMLSGVYNNMFYHHGCGSRPTRNAHGDGLWGDMMDVSHYTRFTASDLMDQLFANPKEYLSRFLWDESLCVAPDSELCVD